MRRPKTKFAGIDLHSNNLVIGVIDQDGTRLTHRKLDCNLQQVKDFLKPLKPQLQSIAVESTSNWYWLVLNDAHRTPLAWIVDNQSAVLILDYIDERFHLLEINGSYLLESSELTNGKVIRILFPGAKRITRISEEGYSLWVRALRKFADFVTNRSPSTRIFLHKAWLASASTDGATCRSFSADRLQYCTASNDMLERYYQATAAAFPRLVVLEPPRALCLAKRNHLWGSAPFHYIDAYYQDFWKQLENAGVI